MMRTDLKDTVETLRGPREPTTFGKYYMLSNTSNKYCYILAIINNIFIYCNTVYINKSGKNTVVINKENYSESQIPNGSAVIVYDKAGERLWNSSVWSNKNNLLIPYILDTIFGN